jgi:hypothetical protein
MPSPIRACRRWTMKEPTSGAAMAMTVQATSARCMKLNSSASITGARRPPQAPGRRRRRRSPGRAGGGAGRHQVHQPAAAHLDDAVGQPGEALRVVADVDDGDPLDLHQVLERVAQDRPASASTPVVGSSSTSIRAA